jgi:hypothetical protein
MSRNIRDKSGNKLLIEEFKFSEMCKDPSIVMVAKRGSGKSWVTRAILNHFHDVPAGIIIAPTDRMNCFYGNFYPSTFIFYEYKSEVIERILARQIMLIRKQKEKAKEGKYIDVRSYIIMDDCLAAKGSWVNDVPIKELLFNGRHYRIMYVLTMQVPLGISPDLRNNFDYVFLLADDIISNLKKIHTHYAGIFPDLASFRQVFNQLTVDFGSMVLINRGARENFLDKVKWYKAPDLTDIHMRFGCDQFRKFHNKNFNDKWEEKSIPFDIADYCAKKKRGDNSLNVLKIGHNESNNHKSNNYKS